MTTLASAGDILWHTESQVRLRLSRTVSNAYGSRLLDAITQRLFSPVWRAVEVQVQSHIEEELYL